MSIQVPGGNAGPFEVLLAAVKQLPVMRFALGVAGLVAVATMLAAWLKNPTAGYFSIVVVLVLCVALIIVSWILRIGALRSAVVAETFLWFVMTVCLFAPLTFAVSSFFFCWPRQWCHIGEAKKEVKRSEVATPEITDSERTKVSVTPDSVEAAKRTANDIRSVPEQPVQPRTVDQSWSDTTDHLELMWASGILSDTVGVDNTSLILISDSHGVGVCKNECGQDGLIRRIQYFNRDGQLRWATLVSTGASKAHPDKVQFDISLPNGKPLNRQDTFSFRGWDSEMRTATIRWDPKHHGFRWLWRKGSV